MYIQYIQFFKNYIKFCKLITCTIFKEHILFCIFNVYDFLKIVSNFIYLIKTHYFSKNIYCSISKLIGDKIDTFKSFKAFDITSHMPVFKVAVRSQIVVFPTFIIMYFNIYTIFK